VYQGKFTSVSNAVSTARYAVGESGDRSFASEVPSGRNWWYDHSFFPAASL